MQSEGRKSSKISKRNKSTANRVPENQLRLTGRNIVENNKDLAPPVSIYVSGITKNINPVKGGQVYQHMDQYAMNESLMKNSIAMHNSTHTVESSLYTG